MDALAAQHPTDQVLHAYGLGKLDDASTESVDAHLETCPDCQRRLAGISGDSFLGRLRAAGVPPPPSSSGAGPPDAVPRGTDGAESLASSIDDPIPAELVELYEIIREIGRGGMGVVYLARHKIMDRLQVLKVLNQNMLSRRGTVERFLREIRVAARLSHSHIVSAYDALQLGGLFVFVMEYVEGEDLAKLVKDRGPLTVAHACYFAYQAALGLQHAHEKGTIHRDIKPGNLILFRQGSRAVVKILDFGLAKAMRETPVDGTLTQEGQMLGTPDYIAPEQIMNAHTTDIRADIYSLGCTLHYLLTGGPPFRGASLYDVYQAHISTDARPLNLIRPEVPVELAAVVGKMMAKDADRRFQTPAEAAEALKPFCKAGANPSTDADAKAFQASQRAAPPQKAGSEFAPRQGGPAPPSPKQRPSKPSNEGVAWNDLIEFNGPERSTPAVEPNPKSLPASNPVQRPWWVLWPKVIAASLFGVVALGIIITIRSKNGETAGGLPNRGRTSHDQSPGNESSVPTANARASGFGSLFNGTDLRGWKSHPSQKGNWQVKEGVLVGSGPDLGYLYSERDDYRDFHLRLEARYNPGCNASLFFCSTYGPILTEQTSGRPRGYEVPINSTRDLLPGGILTAPGDVEWACFMSWVTPPPNTWFTLDLIVDGGNIEVMLNGITTAYHNEAPRLFSSGHFALQLSSLDSVIEIRKIELKEFKSTDRQDPRELARLFGHSGRVDLVCFSPDGKRLLSTGSQHDRGHLKGADWYIKGSDDTVRLWDATSGQGLFTMSEHNWGVRSLAFSPDGKSAVSCSGWLEPSRQDILVWDLTSGRRIHRLTRLANAGNGVERLVAFSADNRAILAVFENATIQPWDLETEKAQAAIRLEGDARITAAIFTSDRKRMITGSTPGPLHLWELPSGKRQKTFVGHNGWVLAVERSADDRVILSAGVDETARVWDAASGKPLQVLDLKDDGLRCVALSSDGHRALTGGRYGTIRLWDLDTGREICRLNGHTLGVNSVAFSPDGQRAVSGSSDRTVRVWKLP